MGNHHTGENGIVTGKIIKGIAGFYYVHTESAGVFECKAKGIFRNQKIKPLVGDDVELDILDEEKKLASIVDILPRKSELIRPAVANADQALVVFAGKDPEPNYSLLDRFLILMTRQKLPVIVCFNKTDLISEEECKKILERAKEKEELEGDKIMATLIHFDEDDEFTQDDWDTLGIGIGHRDEIPNDTFEGMGIGIGHREDKDETNKGK